MNSYPYPASEDPRPRTRLTPGRSTGVMQGARSQAQPAAELPRWSSETLLNGGHQVEITHGDQVYRLRLTSLGKLILTK